MIRLAVIAAVVAVGAGRARAYPHYQFASDTGSCRECHLAPAGGGLLTDWGHGELGDTLAMGGDGAALHGAPLPGWLALGGDVRLAGLVEDGGAEGARLAIFPMQLELATRVTTAGVSITATLGARAAARSASARPDDAAGGFHGLAAISREHYLAYQPTSGAWMVRAGRFAAPFGLRLADHTAFVRRHLGYGLFEETYGVGGAWLGGTTEVHATAFVSDPLGWARTSAAGVAALLERRGDGWAALGSTRATASVTERTIAVGIAGKYWLPGPKVLLMAEVDGGWQQFPEADAGRPFAVAWAGPTWSPIRGVVATLAAEAFLPDAQLPSTGRVALSPSVTVMPWAHVELSAQSRLQAIAGGAQAEQLLVQVHYLP
ncbi:MAG: hypothetical protein IPL61_38965 [Myxococcales bacterium]|nr:hypothetical protein [Myxococcales bacterium]